MNISDIVSRRGDLSTFLVHLTKKSPEGSTDRANLDEIISKGQIEARNAYGHGSKKVALGTPEYESQKVVCFTETPLEYINLLTQSIEGRDFQYAPYGIVLPKKVGRQMGVNPVWYLDMTIGHDWLTNDLDRIVDGEIVAGNFLQSSIAKLTPFIEQMGTWGNSRKEFWWEREWRHVGNFKLPPRFIGLCPESEIVSLERLCDSSSQVGKFIDPSWGLEEIIGHLAGFDRCEIGVF